MGFMALIRRIILNGSNHFAIWILDCIDELDRFDLERNIRRAADPEIRAAWEAVKESKKHIPIIDDQDDEMA